MRMTKQCKCTMTQNIVVPASSWWHLLASHMHVFQTVVWFNVEIEAWFHQLCILFYPKESLEMCFVFRFTIAIATCLRVLKSCSLAREPCSLRCYHQQTITTKHSLFLYIQCEFLWSKRKEEKDKANSTENCLFLCLNLAKTVTYTFGRWNCALLQLQS